MKYYSKFLWMAVFCGAFCIFGSTRYNPNPTILFSDVIMLLGFEYVDFFPQYIPIITYWYLPLIIFQIFYGTYIYRHFCSASVYFFSRYCSRTLWFLKETGVLYLFGLAYLIVMILSGTFITSFFTPVSAGTTSWLLACYYLLIHSLFLLVTTLGINILAIVFTSNVGFMIIEGISLFSMASFAVLGKYFITEDILIDKYTWLLKINPFAHLVFSMHSSGINSVDRIINTKSISFDLNLSVLVFLMAAIIVTVCGCMMVSNHNFIESNKETGGI